MAGTKGCDAVRLSESQKAGTSSDCGLQPAHMKSELLVIVNQHVAVNPFPGLLHTTRHTTEVGGARSQWPNRKEGAVEGETNDWGEVVTR